MGEHTHYDPTGEDPEPYTHTHVDPECTHHWANCPVHTPADGSMPSFVKATTCIYGGTELEDGGTWDMDTSKAVWNRVADRLLS